MVVKLEPRPLPSVDLDERFTRMDYTSKYVTTLMDMSKGKGEGLVLRAPCLLWTFCGTNSIDLAVHRSTPTHATTTNASKLAQVYLATCSQGYGTCTEST